MPSANQRIQYWDALIEARPRRAARILALALAWLAIAPAIYAPAFAPALADDAADARQTVDKARQTIEDFKADPDMGWFRDNLPDAKAIMVIPVLIKAGFIIGGSGGHGVVLWRDEASGRWSYPSFTFMGSVTFGLQIGGEAAEVVLMIRSDRGRRALFPVSRLLNTPKQRPPATHPIPHAQQQLNQPS